MNTFQKFALIITLIGAVNWGLLGIFNFNLVTSIAGTDTFLSNIIYIIIGICGLINIMILFMDFDNTVHIDR